MDVPDVAAHVERRAARGERRLRDGHRVWLDEPAGLLKPVGRGGGS